MSDKPSVDDLRARLKDLGYLDAGVDRFVLGPVRPERGLLSVAARASSRIGVLAGLLVGPSASASLAVRLPGLVTGLHDGVVLAVYLGVIFGVAVTLAAFLVSWLLGVLVARMGGAWRGRAQPLARVAGLLVAAACLAYLVLWWRTVTPAGSTWAGGAWTFPALGAAAALSLLIGHVVTLTTLAVVAHASGVPDPELKLGARSWPLTIGLGLAAFGAAAGLLFLLSRGDPLPVREAAPAKGIATATGVRLTVIGIDGFDRQFVERLRQAGRLPRLARLLDGARATFPPSDAPDPARTWTSIATGQPPDVHGVSGIETRRVAGTEGTVTAEQGTLGRVVAAATDLVRLTRPALTTGLQRRSKTFWEVAADYGLGTVVVNWWATWPAPEASGVVLSDRATLRLERGGALDAEIAPSDLYAPLLRQWPGVRDQARRRVVAAFPSEHDPVERVLRQAAEQDALPVALLHQFGTPSADLSTVYLPGLDIAHYALLGPSAGGGLPASAVAARVEALERYYLFLEELIAPLIEGAGDQGLVALIADPGRSGASEQGLLALAGAPARADADVEVGRHDIMPTLLYALGVPASRELPGRPRLDLLSPAFTVRAPLREVDGYGRRVIAPRPANVTPLDREMMERLKSLGYVR
ncbi:MAG: hypothetical protein EHM24_24960 [Acidobacteria bacterium]|nr:MAG: hypothetical protein EHM24_24960 [Acidobacteriota bacterium]